MNLLEQIQARFRQALGGLVSDVEPYVAMIKPAQDAKFGDYQANCAMSLAKVLGKKPRDIAQDIVNRLDLGDLLQAPEIAGPGFINLRLQNTWMAARLQEMARSDRLGVGVARPVKTFVIDYSSPNVAKPMHVGHLRTTIIGDSLTRLLRFLGHTVITDNHLGDWGTQFGIILYGYKNFLNKDAFAADPVRELARLYLHVRDLMKSDEDDERAGDLVGDACRLETAKLHSGDEENVRLWKMFMPYCLEDLNRIYRRLDVHFDHTLGESFYNPMLPSVVRSLMDKGIAKPSQGAVAIFYGEDKPPALVQKKDGAFTYTTTDLATVRYRVEQLHGDTLLYVVDARQALHFKNLFDAACRWGYDGVRFEHVSFGSVLGKDGKPIKTRERATFELTEESAAGLREDNVPNAVVSKLTPMLNEVFHEKEVFLKRVCQYLTEEELFRYQSRFLRHAKGGAIELNLLLNEAVERAIEIVNENSPYLSEAERSHVAEAVGLGAVKYADLAHNRTSDYQFNWDKMLAMDGNTATYMQYAYARNRSIFAKGNVEAERFRTDSPMPVIEKTEERNLSLHLLRFEDALLEAAAEYQPSAITTYLWNLAKSYSGFFQNCPVLKAETPALRDSRLLLCDLTARVIQRCLDLLGIRTVERM
jgi:arginyl-tRNA synthetase